MQLLATIKNVLRWDITAAMHFLPTTPNLALNTSAGPILTENSPFLTEYMMVHSGGFKGMAYRDTEGHWRAAYTDSRLPDPVRILG